MTIKRLLIFTLVLIISFSMSVVCFARFNIDGVQRNSEWADSELYVLGEDTGFNNDIDFAYLRARVDDEADVIYLCLSALLKHIETPDAYTVILKINSGEQILIKLNGDALFDSQKYSVKSASTIDLSSKTAFTELSVALKEGLLGETAITVCFVDTRGISSNVFNIALNNEDNEQSQQDQAQDEPEKTSKTDKTTSKATKKSSTKTTKTTRPFNYKRVYGKAVADESSEVSEVEYESASQAQQSEEAPFEDLTDNTPDKSVAHKKIIIALGAACAVAVLLCVVTAEIIKRRKSE